MVKIHFSDFFGIDPDVLDEYGAFNISLINDLPLFIDPFLLFNSTNSKYRQLHAEIIRYVTFLRDKAIQSEINSGLLIAWFTFKEVKQNWLGYSMVGNNGTGLGKDFAIALRENLYSIFANFGSERITKGSHLEKLCLISDRVGRDNISDFCTNLIKGYLLEYTQEFARSYIDPKYLKVVNVSKARFNYDTETWESNNYVLPYTRGDYVILTPSNILTKDDIWISKGDLLNNYNTIAESIPNEQLRAQLDNFLLHSIPPNPKREDISKAIAAAMREYPELIDYYIRYKEDKGDEAQNISAQKVEEVRLRFVRLLSDFVQVLKQETKFYDKAHTTYEETRERIVYLKHVIENNDGYRVFYLDGKAVKREQDIQILFRLVWFGTESDVNREVNNGRGPVDYKISRGSKDKTLVEFKLASNSQLRKNLENQVKIYEKANKTEMSFKVILCFSQSDHDKVEVILRQLGLQNKDDIILIDARQDNKVSASKAE